ncbi:hypothetical protein B0O99DRAFT_284239 [Bisporella sp. PMI_857]|nr:hypothetical protein B0O99DRAFT_284239 [Bisporella sp. PMI_857]
MQWLRKKRKLNLNIQNESCGEVNQKFDGATGQIYTETTTAIQSTSDRDWTRKGRLVVGPSYREIQDYEGYVNNFARHSTKDIGQYREDIDNVKNSRARRFTGARSLQDAAIECVLQNISDIELEGIECLPEQLTRRIWHAANQRCTSCFNTWSIFSKVLRDTGDPSLELLRFRQILPSPSSRLFVYTSPITSKSFEFLTSLSITSDFPVPDIYSLFSVTNLGTLELVNTAKPSEIKICDRLVRSWQMLAQEGRAFQVLRILRLWNYKDITKASLNFLGSFPALAIFDVRGCSFDHSSVAQAQQVGWKTVKDKDLLDLLNAKCIEQVSTIRRRIVKNYPAQLLVSSQAYSQPFWDSSKVKYIPAEEVPGFLAQRKPTEDRVGPCLIDPNTGTVGGKQTEVRHNLQSNLQPNQLKAPITWDFRTSSSFARIGELRRDTDLLKAGMRIKKQAIVGNELINSIPIASLCLGPTQPLTLLYKERGYAFVRMGTSSQTSTELKRKASADAEAAIPTALSDSKFGTKSKSTQPRQTVSKRKKKNLGDVLSSLL